MKPTHDFAVSVENYLKAIWNLSQSSGRRVANKDLCRHLGVRAPSVTRMIQKLQRLKLVHGSGGLIALSSEGQKSAVELIRRHRIVEMYLTRSLNLDPIEAHHHAELLEHAVEERLAERMWESLGCPSLDHQGMQIPAHGSFRFSDNKHSRIHNQQPHQMIQIESLADHDPELLQGCLKLGLQVGQTFKIESINETIVRLKPIQGKGGKFIDVPKSWAESISVKEVHPKPQKPKRRPTRVL